MAEKMRLFNPDEVTIHSDGTVVIANPELARLMIRTMRTDPGSIGWFDNCDCPRKGAPAERVARQVRLDQLEDVPDFKIR